MLTLKYSRMAFITTLALIAALGVPASCSQGQEPPPRSVQLSAYFINEFIQEYAKSEKLVPPEPGAISRALAAGAETSEQTTATLLGLFVHTSAPDVPLPELARMLHDVQADEEYRLMVAFCLAKVICGRDEKRAAEADSVLLQAFRNRQNTSQLRGQLCLPLSISTRSPYILLGDLTETLLEPDCVMELREQVGFAMSGLVNRRVLTREAVWSMLALTLRRVGFSQNARQHLLLVLGQVSSPMSAFEDGKPLTRQLLWDTEQILTRDFLDERNDGWTRAIASIGIGLSFSIEPATLEVARDLIERETTSEKLREACERMIEKSKRTDEQRLRDLDGAIETSKGIFMKRDWHNPDFTFDAAWR